VKIFRTVDMFFILASSPEFSLHISKVQTLKTPETFQGFYLYYTRNISINIYSSSISLSAF